jgi:hypothetical protein
LLASVIPKPHLPIKLHLIGTVPWFSPREEGASTAAFESWGKDRTWGVNSMRTRGPYSICETIVNGQAQCSETVCIAWVPHIMLPVRDAGTVWGVTQRYAGAKPDCSRATSGR